MALTRKPIPKSQVELSQQTIQPYLNQGKVPVPATKKRQNQRTLKGDDVKQFSVGLKDVDESIFYYFDNIIRPSVIQNGTKINVPILYGSPERWAAMQKDGFYRDNNGKIQTPLIMVKRDSIEKNRTLGNKMDANNPIHFGVFEKKYSQKNTYDRFSIINNRVPVREYYGVIIPDYVNLVYSCVIFTEYVEQMNKIIESVNFASDSYWGDPERFKFRAAIDNYTTTTELIEGGDRTVKTSFQIKIAGYIVSDAINTSIGNPNKFFSKAAVKFSLETAGTAEILTAKASTPVSQAPIRFFDTVPTGTANQGMTPQQIVFVGINTTVIADQIVQGIAIFTNHTIVTPPEGFTITQESFQVYINGVLISTVNRVVTQVQNNIQISFTNLDFNLDSQDQVILVGKFN